MLRNVTREAAPAKGQESERGRFVCRIWGSSALVWARLCQCPHPVSPASPAPLARSAAQSVEALTRRLPGEAAVAVTDADADEPTPSFFFFSALGSRRNSFRSFRKKPTFM